MNTFPALLAFCLAWPAAPGEGEKSWSVAVQPEEPNGYAANPSTLHTPLRQDLRALRIERLDSGRHTLRLEGGPSAIVLSDVDLGLLLPRVPAYARANDDLLRYALAQREFNRNEVKFGPTGEAAEFKLANNCLRTSLWEVMLDTKLESGNAMSFHGWFAFPPEEHARLFQALNGRAFAECEAMIARYPVLDGMPAPLDALRTVRSERKLGKLQTFPAEAPIRFGEQKRKQKLLLTPGIATYADFVAPAKQPIRTASFREPGFYDPENPVEFDLTWLAPEEAWLRDVLVGTTPASELEIRFAGGRRLVVADRDLAALPAREQAPDDDKATLRLTFGIGTPDIYATLAERSAERDAERPNWLFLLGPDGKHVDNHQAGVDRVFCWNEQGKTLHLYLVGYERIAVVAHLAVPLSAE